MGANSRRRHLERIIKRSVPKQLPPNPDIQVVKPINPFRIKRSIKVFAVFGWIVLGIAWLTWWRVTR